MKDYAVKVKAILEKNEEARDNDFILWLAMIDEVNPMWSDLFTFREGLTAIKDDTNKRLFPQFESVRRCRQQVQHDCPWLCGKRRLERMEEEEIYHNRYMRR